MSEETKKEKVDKEIVKLYDYTSSITTIMCHNCKKEEEYDGDAFDCLDTIYEEGWRVKGEECLCKNCVKEFGNKKK